jgi:hypothetical protein
LISDFSYTTTDRAGFAHSQQNGVTTDRELRCFEKNGERKNFRVLLEQAREMQDASLR